MSEVNKVKRLSKVAREFNLGLSTIVDFLGDKGVTIDSNPNAKIESDAYDLLVQEYDSERVAKEESRQLGLNKVKRETITLDETEKPASRREEEQEEIIIKNMHNVTEQPVDEVVEAPESVPVEEKPIDKVEAVPAAIDEDRKPEPAETSKETEEVEEKGGLSVVGKIDLDALNLKTRPDKKKDAAKGTEKKKSTKVEPAKPAAEKKVAKPKTEEKKERDELPTDTATPIADKKDAAENKEKKTSSNKPEHIKTDIKNLTGPTVVGKIVLPEKPSKKKPVASSSDNAEHTKKKRRKRIKSGPVDQKPAARGIGTPQKVVKPGTRKPAKVAKPELTEEQIASQVRETLARLSGGGKSKGSKHRKARREAEREKSELDLAAQEAGKSLLKVTEFVTASELATMMNVGVNEIISACMSLGLFVSINQRLDAETISIVSEEFGFEVEFVSAGVQEAIQEEEDLPEDLIDRAPIVTVMGHVDHGKTSLLDYIRRENVIAGEAGGITQHIGAYSVDLESGKRITFLDTPGHEAFTAMRARGAKITDLAVIVVAADDNVMPQTIEAINHAQAAGVPMVFAINKMDKDGANAERIKEELSKKNILVEDWGGKYQSQEISAKKGLNIAELLDKVLLEAEMLELKANPNKNAVGSIIESSLDKGRGFVTTLLVQSGTLKKGDLLISGTYYGRVKAMHNERGASVESAGPSVPVTVLGLNGAPAAGETFNVMLDEKEAKAIVTKRETLQREQGLRTQKHVTLDEIGRRLAIGDFKELNLIVKGDVDGSIEALSDALLKLSTDKIQVNIIHKSVGQISESDVLLASASDAIIIGFQVRPSTVSRKLAEKEEIDVRLYSVIYDAVEEIKDAMEGMLSPTVVEKIVCNIEIRDVFKITKVGTVAGCYVLDGKIHRNTKIRLIRDGIVVYTGNLGSLKRFKDDVKEVNFGYECGLNIDKFSDIKVGDIIEGYEEVEVKQKL